MIRQAEDTGLTLECFAQEAADRVAQLWSERGNMPLSAHQKDELINGIWECLFSEDRAEAENEASSLMPTA